VVGAAAATAARGDAERLFLLALLDIWASLLCALRLPEPELVALKAKVHSSPPNYQLVTSLSCSHHNYLVTMLSTYLNPIITTILTL
jgi:hypothetical protein